MLLELSSIYVTLTASSAISLRPLRSLDRHDLFVPRAQAPVFAITGPALWNQQPPSTLSSLLNGEPSASLRSLKIVPLYVSLALNALLIDVHCKKRYVTHRYNTIHCIHTRIERQTE